MEVDFADADLSNYGRSLLASASFRNPHKPAEVWLPEEGIVFPLKAEYERQNHTLEGIKERRAKEGDLFTLPPDAPPGGGDSTSRAQTIGYALATRGFAST